MDAQTGVTFNTMITSCQCYTVSTLGNHITQCNCMYTAKKKDLFDDMLMALASRNIFHSFTILTRLLMAVVIVFSTGY